MDMDNGWLRFENDRKVSSVKSTEYKNDVKKKPITEVIVKIDLLLQKD